MIKLKKLLKEELSKGEQFGIKEAASNIVSLHKQLNQALLQFMNGTKKMAYKHKKDEVGKDLEDLYKTTKGNYYYATKQASGQNFGGGSWGKLVTKLLGKNSIAQALGEGKLTEGPKTSDVVTTWWKVWVDGYKEPLTLIGKDERSVKQTVHSMTYPTKVKIKRIKKIRQEIG